MRNAGRASAGSGPAGALMDGIYRRQRHIYDATRCYFLLGRDHLVASLDPSPGGTVLEIGCGTARNLLAAARRYPDASFFGVDVSTEMLATAETAIRRAGLSGRIRLARGDAADFDPEALFGISAFDRVFFSYSLSMIPCWREALRQGARLAAAAGGRLQVVDFGRQERLPLWFRAALFAWLDRFHVTPRADLERALGTIAGSETLECASLFRGYVTYAQVSFPAPAGFDQAAAR